MKVPTRGGGCVHCGHDHFHRECLTCRDTDGPCRAVMVWEAKALRATIEDKVNTALARLPVPAPRPAFDPDAMAAAVQRGRLEERGDVVAWLDEAQYHVVNRDEVAVIIKLKHQFSRGAHERRNLCDND